MFQGNLWFTNDCENHVKQPLLLYLSDEGEVLRGFLAHHIEL
jgi:hypothetical protein